MQENMQENSEDYYFGGWILQDDAIEIVENILNMQEMWWYGEEMKGKIWVGKCKKIASNGGKSLGNSGK